MRDVMLVRLLCLIYYRRLCFLAFSRFFFLFFAIRFFRLFSPFLFFCGTCSSTSFWIICTFIFFSFKLSSFWIRFGLCRYVLAYVNLFLRRLVNRVYIDARRWMVL